MSGVNLNADQIGQLIINALERIAFVSADPIGGVKPEDAARHARISFQGAERSGDIYLSASDGFLCELAGNLVGAEPEEIDAEVDGVQALTELANIVGGELILAMGAATERFDLGLPEEMEGPPETLRPAIQATVESEGGLLTLSLDLR